MTDKRVLINGVSRRVTVKHLGANLVWIKERSKLITHIVSRDFWDGNVPAYQDTEGVKFERIEPVDQNLIERIEYVLHSGYDANDRELLREALAALKEKA